MDAGIRDLPGWTDASRITWLELSVRRNWPDRFWTKVDRTSDPAGCWLWRGFIMPNGYGQTYLDGGHKYAHRVAYEEVVGPIPEGLQIDHLCRIRNCVNPAHLEPVTLAENLRRGIHLNSTKTGCPRGHPYDKVIDGRRVCTLCLRRQRRDSARRCRARVKAAAMELS